MINLGLTWHVYTPTWNVSSTGWLTLLITTSTGMPGQPREQWSEPESPTEVSLTMAAASTWWCPEPVQLEPRWHKFRSITCHPQGMCGSIKRVLPPVCTSKLLILIAFIVGNLKDFKSEAASVSSSWAGAAWATWLGHLVIQVSCCWCLSQQSLRWFSFFGRIPKHGNYCHYCLFLFKLWLCHTQRRKSKSGLVNQL